MKREHRRSAHRDDEPGGGGGHRHRGGARRASRWPARAARPRWAPTASSPSPGSSRSRPIDNPKMAVAVTLERTTGPGRHGGRADRHARCWRRLLETDDRGADNTLVDGRYRIVRRHRLRRDGRRLLRRGHAPRARGGAQGAAPPLRPGPGVRGALPPRGQVRGRACSTRTWSACSTAASTTAPTTSRWSTCAGARSRTSSRPRRR